MREYVKEFSSIIIDIRNMFEEDKLFNFMIGLQSWAQMELRRLAVKDLPSAMVAADSLLDFKMSDETQSEMNVKENGKDKKFRNREEEKAQENEGQHKAKKMRIFDKGKSKDFWTSGCFICRGPHLAKVCPKKERLDALIVEEDAEEAVRVNPLQIVNP